MKRSMVVTLSLMLVFVLSTGVWAIGPGYGHHSGNSLYQNPQGNPLTQEQIEKLNKFKVDTLQLRQKMLQLRTDLSVLNSKKPIDYKTIAEKEKEMVDVRLQIHKKAVESGVADFLPRGYGMRQGRGMGPCMMDGFGPAGYNKAKKNFNPIIS
ncbi:MAG TPA: hypothetical protein HPP56_02050 [Nitrospirae bacterium]|nr:hypothetical protein [Nitrospirota bacterium]